MYKVFVNDCQIILTENKNISTKLVKINFEDVSIVQLVEKCFSSKIEGICLICSSLKYSWSLFKSYFEIQEAAGGKVFNNKNEVLFIYRFDKWDLPKGKLEAFETIENCAIREVEEECGITNLIIEKQLDTTYHIFERKHKLILKISHWFLMNTNYTGELKPQIEEGITQVIFKNEAEIEEALSNTYQNIKLLF